MFPDMTLPPATKTALLPAATIPPGHLFPVFAATVLATICSHDRPAVATAVALLLLIVELQKTILL
jgi:hypothetical protein